MAKSHPVTTHDCATVTDNMLQDNAMLEAWRICYIANHYVFPLFKKFEKEFKITRPEWVTLFVLGHEEGICAQDVVIKTGLPKNSISRGVNLLLKKKLIKKKNDPTDRRRSLLELTANGWKLFSQTLPYTVARKEQLISTLSSEELKLFNSLILKLCEGVETQLHTNGIWD